MGFSLMQDVEMDEEDCDEDEFDEDDEYSGTMLVPSPPSTFMTNCLEDQ